MRTSPRSKRASTIGRIGRPPAGDGGARVKDYPQVSFRLPTETRDKLAALSTVRKQPQWRLVVESIECYLRDISHQEQMQIARLLPRRQKKSLQ